MGVKFNLSFLFKRCPVKNRHFLLPRMPSLRGMAMAIGLVALSPGSQAVETASGSAYISNLRYELVDLNPMDGIAPSLTWTTTSTYIYGYRDDGYVFQELNNGSIPIARSWTNGSDHLAASVTGASTFQTTILATNQHAGGSTPDSYAALARADFDFTLGAGTGVVFYSDYALRATRTTVGDENGGSWAAFLYELTATENSAPWSQATTVIAAPEWASELDGTSSLFYNNTTGTDWTGMLHASASGASAVAPQVPEPSTYAMLAAGLALLAVRRCQVARDLRR